MKEQIQKRLNSLKSEFESGQGVLKDLEEKHANVHETLLRISGAIQVLEEELNKADQMTNNPEHTDDEKNNPDSPSFIPSSLGLETEALTDSIDMSSTDSNGHYDPVTPHLSQGE